MMHVAMSPHVQTSCFGVKQTHLSSPLLFSLRRTSESISVSLLSQVFGLSSP